MKTLSFFKQIFIAATVYSLLFSCSHKPDPIPLPKIKDGIAKFSGKITNNGGEELVLTLIRPDVVTGEILQTETKTDSAGNFNFEVPVSTDLSVANVAIHSRGAYFTIGLSQKKETRVEVELNGNDRPSLNYSGALPLNKYDNTEAGYIHGDLSNYVMIYMSEPIYDKTSAQYIEFMRNVLAHQAKALEDSSDLSPFMREFLRRDVAFSTNRDYISHYVGIVKRNYQKMNPDADPESFAAPAEPGLEYYSYLKDFDLNSPLNLYLFELPLFYEQILNNKVFGLSPIGETPVKEWLEKAKSVFSGLTDLEEGQFYELLVTNAYSMPMKQLTPLTEVQKQNIVKYFGNSDMSKILLRKSTETQTIVETQKVVVRETPDVPNEELMDAITAKYRGKVIMVDLWATWCGPCLAAMDKIKPLKSDMADKDVVFIYITGTSSPKELWEEKIQGITGEHYYFNTEQWNWLMDNFETSSIPTYLFFGKDGTFIEKSIGFPGTIEIERILTKAVD